MPKVTKKFLLLFAGIFWMIAGFFVMKIGILLLIAHSSRLLLLLPAGIVIFSLFFWKVFLPLVHKHHGRIQKLPNQASIFAFFDRKSYVIMVCMMGGGILLRKFGLLPLRFIAFFYSGLGAALFCSGVAFVIEFWKRKH